MKFRVFLSMDEFDDYVAVGWSNQGKPPLDGDGMPMGCVRQALTDLGAEPGCGFINFDVDVPDGEDWKARAEKAERERDEAKSREDSAISLMTNMENERDILRESDTNLRAALDAADRLAEMVRQHAAQDAGYGASSDITTGDIGQEYEFYQAARAAVGKAGD